MDFTKIPTNITPELTKPIAQEIYDLIKQYGNCDLAYKLKGNSNYEPEHFIIVDKECDLIVSQINILASCQFLIQEQISHIDEMTGELVIDTPVEYFTPTDIPSFIAMLNSDLLDPSVLLQDYVLFKGFNYPTEWTDFLNSYKNEGITQQ